MYFYMALILIIVDSLKSGTQYKNVELPTKTNDVPLLRIEYKVIFKDTYKPQCVRETHTIRYSLSCSNIINIFMYS